MKNTPKTRKNVNVSLQSKLYSKPINDILDDWTEDNLNISIEVCNSILLSDKICKSPTLSNVITATDLVQKILDLYKIEKTDALIENILSQLIVVNTSQLNNIISNCINNTDTISNKLNSDNSSSKNAQININNEEHSFNKQVEVIQTKQDINKTKEAINNFEYTEDVNNNSIDSDYGNYEIPMNFLLND